MLGFLVVYSELQKIDAERVVIEQQLQAYPAKLAAMDGRLRDARKGLEALQEEKEASELQQRELEREIAALEERIQHYAGQQTRVTNEKQLHALEHEVASLRGRISPLEDKILGLMTRADVLATEIPRAWAALGAIESDCQKERSRIEEQVKTKREALDLLMKDWRRLRGQLDAAQQKDYDILTARYPGKVVAVVRGEVCGGCHTPVIPNFMVAVRRGVEPVRCSNCGRFLCLADAPKPGAGPEAP